VHMTEQQALEHAGCDVIRKAVKYVEVIE
jgi:hypothetical protein